MDPVKPNAANIHDTAQADAIAKSKVALQGDLTPAEQQALEQYRKTDLVWRANNHLRGQEGILTKAKSALVGPDREMLSKIKDIDTAIAKSKVTDDLTVMRGFRLDQDPMQVFRPGSTFSEPAFASTTLAKPVAEKFSTSFTQNQVLMEIDVPKGTSGFHMPRKEGEYDEAEVLLPRGSQFKVRSVEKRQSDGKYIVKAGYEKSEPTELNEEGGVLPKWMHFDRGGMIPDPGGEPEPEPPKPGVFSKLKQKVASTASKGKQVSQGVFNKGSAAYSMFSTITGIPGVDPMAAILAAASMLQPAAPPGTEQAVLQKENTASQIGVDERSAMLFGQLRRREYEESKSQLPVKPPIHKEEGGVIPPHPGIPIDADEVPIKAKAGEFVMPVEQTDKYRHELEAMRSDQVPHFEKGGEVKKAKRVDEEAEWLKQQKQQSESAQGMSGGPPSSEPMRGTVENANVTMTPEGMAGLSVPTAQRADEVPMVTPAPEEKKSEPLKPKIEIIPVQTTPSGQDDSSNKQIAVRPEHPQQPEVTPFQGAGGIGMIPGLGMAWDVLSKLPSEPRKGMGWGGDWGSNQQLQQQVYGKSTVAPFNDNKTIGSEVAGLARSADNIGSAFGLPPISGLMGGQGGNPDKPNGGGGMAGMLAGAAAMAFPATAPFAPAIGAAVGGMASGAGGGGGGPLGGLLTSSDSGGGDVAKDLVKILKELVDTLKGKNGSESGGLNPVTGEFTATLGRVARTLVGADMGAIARNTRR